MCIHLTFCKLPSITRTSFTVIWKYINFLFQNTWNSECLKTKMLQHSLSKAFVEPHSFVLSSVQQFEIPNPTRFFDQPTESNEKSAPVLIFKVSCKYLFHTIISNRCHFYLYPYPYKIPIYMDLHLT